MKIRHYLIKYTIRIHFHNRYLNIEQIKILVWHKVFVVLLLLFLHKSDLVYICITP